MERAGEQRGYPVTSPGLRTGLLYFLRILLRRHPWRTWNRQIRA